MKRKYTKDILEPIIKNSISISEVIRKTGNKVSGGMYTLMKRYIKKYNIDTSHFKGQAHGTTFPPKRPIEDYLSNKISINSHALRIKIINEKLKSHRCENCLNTHWMGELIPLDLHHIDKDHHNNNLTNLLLLCPNCHRQKHQAIKKLHTKKLHTKKYNHNSKAHLRKVSRPPYNVLIEETQKFGFSRTGRKYDVSDNAIRKWIKHYEKYIK